MARERSWSAGRENHAGDDGFNTPMARVRLGVWGLIAATAQDAELRSSEQAVQFVFGQLAEHDLQTIRIDGVAQECRIGIRVARRPAQCLQLNSIRAARV
jgi:hypothetical protein